MDWLSQGIDWIANKEALLSGIAAVVAIVAIISAFGSRIFKLLRARTDNSNSTDQVIPENQPLRQEVRYCKLPNESKIAWASTGNGYPIIRSLGWFTNLDVEWNSPVAASFWNRISRQYQLIRYDGRGMGLSDRDVEEFSHDTRLEDLEAVIDASGLEKFALMGLSEGGPTAIRYAWKYPDRVSHLILWGSFLTSPSIEDVPQIAAIAAQIPKFWGSDSVAFHQMFTATFLPDGNADQNKLFNELQRTSASPESAFNFIRSIPRIDVRDIASEIKVPTIVLHRKGDLAVPCKYGQDIAAHIPNAQIELLEGNNHWMISGDDDIDYIAGLIEDFVQT